MSLVKHLVSLVRLQDILDHNKVMVTSSPGSVVEVTVSLAVVLLALDAVAPE